MLIGEIAKASGVSIHTVRYYEKFGLFSHSGRRKNSYKEYDKDIIPLIAFIQKSQTMGFKLAELKAILLMLQSKRSSCSQLQPVAEKKLLEIDQKIKDLQTMKKAMKAIVKKCQRQPQEKACSLVAELC